MKRSSTPTATRPWMVFGLLVSMAGVGQAQRAGEWETRLSVAGQPVGGPVRACIVADVPLRLLRVWPAECVGEVRRTSAGFVSEAACRTARPGTRLTLRRALSGNLTDRYMIASETRVVQAGGASSPPQRVVATNRYLGPCAAAAGYGATGAEASLDPRAVTGHLPMFVLQLIAFAGLIFGMFRRMAWLSRRLGRRAYERATIAHIVVDAMGAATIPVLATFTGVRGLPWWYAVASNNARPILVIAPDGIGYRVVRRRERRYGEIACVDVRQATGTVNLDVTFHGSLLTFSADLGAVPLAAHVLGLLPASVPLSARAVAVKAPAA